MSSQTKKTVAVCEIQPLTTEGLRVLLDGSSDLEFLGAADSLPGGLDLVRRDAPAVMILDKAFGAQAVLDTLAALRATATAPVVWASSITQAESLRFVQAGARGVIRKSAELETLVVCLRSVASGATWMEEDAFHAAPTDARDPHAGLTPRERQVMQLVGQGLKNREIGCELGIRPGTVKVHLKHIFEKTGIRGRFGLALSGLHPPSGDTPRTYRGSEQAG
jgi:DNA-binding NarL/FixJ family response regulator